MNEFDQAMAEFLSKGGKVQEIPSGKSGIVPGQSNSPWGKKKKAVEAVEEVEELVVEPEVIDLDELQELEEADAEDDLEDEE
jgi:hypothetical protein